jgi:hypothetical protein
MTAARPSPYVAPDRVTPSLLQRKRLQCGRQTKAGRDDSISTVDGGLYRFGDFVGFGRNRQFLANSLRENGFWVAVIAYLILAVGNLFRGL